MECYSALQKECIWVSPNEVDEPRAYCAEWSKSERQMLYINIYMGSGKNGTDEPICKAAVETQT